jgi:hypothetical protein
MFHQGVVTARDASLLGEGELVQADDCIYRPNDPAIWKAPGRTAYGTVQSDAVASVTVSSANALLTKANGFGTDVSSTTTLGSKTVTSAAGFTAGMIGQRVYGSGIPSGTYVTTFTSSSSIEISVPATASATVTLTFSTYEPGMYLKGTRITTDATILSVDSASQLTMSANGLTSGTDTVTISSKIKALLYLAFDSSRTDQLIAYANSRLYKSNYTAATGTFASFLTGLVNGGTEHMEAIKSGEAYFLLSPGNTPRRVGYKDASGTDTLTGRAMGMQPVTKFIAQRITASWSSTLGNATYYFVVTEVFNPGESDEVEGTFDGDPQFITISDYLTQGIRIYHNAAGDTTSVNDGTNGTNRATHWRVYMAPGQSTITPIPAFHLYRRVADVDVTQAFIDLRDSNPTTAFANGSATDSVGFTNPFAAPSGTVGSIATQAIASVAGTNGAFTLTTASSIASLRIGMPAYANNVAAGAVILQLETGSPNTITLDKANVGTVSGTVNFGPSSARDSSPAYSPNVAGVGIRVSNFGFINSNQYSGRAVIGVEVRINYLWRVIFGNGNSGEDRGFNVSMLVGGSPTNTKLNVGHRTGQGSSATFGSNRYGNISVGGSGDTWGRVWNTGLQDFVDGNFFVRVGVAASGVFQEHFIDTIEVKVFFSGKDVDLDGEEFRTVIFTTQVGETVTIGAAGPPPLCDTGDIIDGQLVVNDLSQDGLIWASLPDEHEAFPKLYKANVTDRRKDVVMVIRRVGPVGIIFCRNSIKRLNYFPTEIDSDATRGRAWEDIANDNGAASKKGVIVFDLPGRGVVAAYVANNGLWLTDGITCWKANRDLDWPATVSISALGSAELRNYPRLYLLALYYTPAGGTLNSKVIYFSYDPAHLKEGYQLAAVGPTQCRAASAVRTDLTGQSNLLTGNSTDGKVYLEDNGNTSADANVTIAPTIVSRLIYPSDVGGQARIERAWLRVASNGNATTGVCSALIRRQDIGANLTDGTAEAFTTDATSLAGDRLVAIGLDANGEAVQLKITKADLDAAFRLHYASLLGEDYGLEKHR